MAGIQKIVQVEAWAQIRDDHLQQHGVTGGCHLDWEQSHLCVEIPFWALQLGVERGARSGDREGWAWVSGQPDQDHPERVMEAYRLADFVRNTLRLEVRCIFSFPCNSWECRQTVGEHIRFNLASCVMEKTAQIICSNVRAWCEDTRQ